MIVVPPALGDRIDRETMAAIRAANGGRCSACGSTRALEFAHVEPTGLCGRGRGLRNRFFDMRKYPECYTLLCRRCHRKRDYEAIRGWLNEATG